LTAPGRTGAVVNAHEIITGQFTRDPEFHLPSEQLRLSLQARLGERLALLDATELARLAMGDTIFSNMIVFGAAWQQGLVPLSHEAILRAIELNGAAVEGNKRAFELGRWAALNPEAAAALGGEKLAQKPKSLAERIALRAEHLEAYQSKRLARRYRRLVESIEDKRLREAVAKGYHKLLAYKDEYEVARLLSDTAKKAAEEFEGDLELTYHLAPPLLSRKGPEGRPVKRAFGPWLARLFPLLARLKFLRGTPFDPFGYSHERRMERALIRQYEADMRRLLDGAAARNTEAAVALAELPLSIRGFGPVKAANAEKAAKRREELWAAIEAGPAPLKEAAE
ncbi:MAG: indolepyruvate ferredoxin oxidoreductase family protein, partial [Alphaproteobacteria bacterium]